MHLQFQHDAFACSECRRLAIQVLLRSKMRATNTLYIVPFDVNILMISSLCHQSSNHGRSKIHQIAYDNPQPKLQTDSYPQTTGHRMADSDESTTLLLSSTAGETHNYKRFGIAASVMLSGVALLLTSNNNAPSSTVNKAKQQSIKQSSSFPDNFIWGAATSAYQIEGGSSAGGRGPSIWDVWCKQSPNNCNSENANVTDDHFHHWQEDIELMHNMGLKAYRFSISWSRILPTGKAEGTESGDHRYSMTKGMNMLMLESDFAS